MNASWRDVVRLQLAPWEARGINLGNFLRETNFMRTPYGTQPPGAAALVDSEGWKIGRIGAKWVAHHATRAAATINLFRLAQHRARIRSRPLPRIRFVLMASDGHGSTSRNFNGSGCTCTREATCCDPGAEAYAPMDAAALPPAPVFATLWCRLAYDVSVPTIIDDLLDTRSEASIEKSLQRWVALGNAQPWGQRIRQAFFVGDSKAHRPKAYRSGLRHPSLFAVHHAVSTNKTARRPFAEHARYRATIYAHGFHFNSVRFRRLSLLGGAVIAEEGPCKEWWQLLARPWIHYAPTTETFSDLPQTAKRLLDPKNDAAACQMGRDLKALGLHAFRAHGLLDYIDELWRAYAALAKLGGDATPARTSPSLRSHSTTTRPHARHVGNHRAK